jgi:hypothetical protein
METKENELGDQLVEIHILPANISRMPFFENTILNCVIYHTISLKEARAENILSFESILVILFSNLVH